VRRGSDRGVTPPPSESETADACHAGSHQNERRRFGSRCDAVAPDIPELEGQVVVVVIAATPQILESAERRVGRMFRVLGDRSRGEVDRAVRVAVRAASVPDITRRGNEQLEDDFLAWSECVVYPDLGTRSAVAAIVEHELLAARRHGADEHERIEIAGVCRGESNPYLGARRVQRRTIIRPRRTSALCGRRGARQGQ